MIDDKGLLGWEIAVEDGYGETNPGALRGWVRALIAEVRAQRETIRELERSKPHFCSELAETRERLREAIVFIDSVLTRLRGEK
jgi:hypothetical protein